MTTDKLNQCIEDEIECLFIELESRARTLIKDEDLTADFNLGLLKDPKKLSAKMMEELELYLMFDVGKKDFFANLIEQKSKTHLDWANKEINNPLDAVYNSENLSKGIQRFNPLERMFDFLVLAKKYNSLGDTPSSLFNILRASEMLGVIKTALGMKYKEREIISIKGGENYKKRPKAALELLLNELLIANLPSDSKMSIAETSRLVSKIPEVRAMALNLGIKDENIETRIAARISNYRKLTH